MERLLEPNKPVIQDMLFLRPSIFLLLTIEEKSLLFTISMGLSEVAAIMHLRQWQQLSRVVSLVHHIKTAQSEWIKQQNLLSHSSGGWNSVIRAL